MVGGAFVRWIALCLISLVIGALVAGCTDLDGARAFRADALQLHHALEADAARWESEASGLPPGDPALPAAQAQAADARAREQLLAAGLSRIDEIIAEAENPSHPLSETVDAASPLLPMPLRGPLLLGAAAVVAGLRAWRLKSGLASVARGLATAMREDEEFRACFARHADTFRATQTPTAKRVVDEVTARRPLLALPV